MNKIKMFFVAASLLLITVGVFAGRNRFTTYTIYASTTNTVSTTSYPLTGSGVSLSGNFTTLGTVQAVIPDQLTGTYGVYAYTTGSSTLTPLYFAE